MRILTCNRLTDNGEMFVLVVYCLSKHVNIMILAID